MGAEPTAFTSELESPTEGKNADTLLWIIREIKATCTTLKSDQK